MTFPMVYQPPISEDISVSFHFPIRILQGAIEIDDVKPSLIEALSEGRIEGGAKRSNIGDTWRSTLTLQHSNVEQVKVLMDRIGRFSEQCADVLYTSAKPVIGECWMNALRNGGYNAPHDHLPFEWSGILWIDAEHETETTFPSGNVEFFSPYASRAFGEDTGSLFVRPKNGVALFFPSGVKHMVHPGIQHMVRTEHTTRSGAKIESTRKVSDTRISMAWNCNIVPKDKS